jgi:hypothetical protein
MERTWTPERVGCWYMGGEGGRGRRKKTRPPLFLNEFRVFSEIGACCVLMKRKRKRGREWK